MQQGQGADGSVQGRGVVRQVGIDLQRRGRGAGAVEVHVAAHGLAGHVISRLVFVRTVLAVAGNVDDGQLLIDVFPNKLIAQAHSGVSAGAAGLNPDICPFQNLFEHFYAAGRVRINGQREAIAMLLGIAVVAAGGAGLQGMLDLQRLSAHFTHQAADVRAGNVDARHHDFYTRQNTELGVFRKFHMSAVIIGMDFRHSTNSFLFRNFP